MVFLACMHLALFLALSLSPGNSLVSLWCDHSMLTSLFSQCLTVSRFVFMCSIHSLHHIVKNALVCFLRCPQKPQNLSQHFISKASRRVSSLFLSIQLSQPYIATGHTSAFISHIFVEIGML